MRAEILPSLKGFACVVSGDGSLWREGGMGQANDFNDTGFRIFKASHIGEEDKRQKSSRRFEHGLGRLDFDEEEGDEEGGGETGMKGGELDSYPIGFGAQ